MSEFDIADADLSIDFSKAKWIGLITDDGRWIPLDEGEKVGAVVLTSGGLDSTTLLFKAVHDLGRDNVRTVSFDYGQRHKKELEAAKDITEQVGVPWALIDLSSLGRLLKGSALSDPDVPVPHGHYAKENMVATIVPNRNTIMLSCAVGIAIGNKHAEVWAAMHAGDHAIYPDCRPDFIDALNATIKLANAWENPIPQVVTPFIHYPKDAIVSLGNELGVPWEMTWSCYEGGDVHCGRCGTCVERAEAFSIAEVKDPTEYADPEYWKRAVAEHAGGV